jgi:isoleucyl-tRNA synthetase
MTTNEKTDYKHTLNLPRTDFPMQAKLNVREPERLAKWAQMDLARKILEKREQEGAPNFCLHDGPPYANGDIHIGHALNKVLKDLVVRYKTMAGHRSYYVPGWDCHGLPIEQKVLQKLGHKARSMPAIEIRRQCHDYARKWVDVQREQFKRLGVGGDWEHPYLTLDPAIEHGILSAFRDLVARGLVNKGFRPVYWDPVYQTALAEAEIEYETHVSDSIYVKFPLIDSESVEALKGLANVSLVIWTTTPWTLPANLAVCLHPDFEYVALAVGAEHFIVARELVESFRKECKIGEARVAATLRAQPLEKMTCRHPIFEDRTSLVILGEHVTLEAGTGCVHTAPGHGVEDFVVGKRYALPVFVPVDNAGRFTADYPEMEGVNVFDANPRLVEKLRVSGLLLGHAKFEHQYPYSWRSHQPIIFRATEQWFMDLDAQGVRRQALEAIDQVQWIPNWGRERIYSMVEQRPDWCLSRQRSWGVPIPAIRSKRDGKSILHPGLIDRFLDLVAKQGTDAWFTEPLESFWPADFTGETGETRPEDFDKEFDILDVWFDSGSTSLSVCERREGLGFPVALYLEGSDQHRGWFQSSLLVAVGARGRAPYEAVLTHGFILDGEGVAMSKSKGNVISPQQIVEKIGADGLRLWVVSEDYRADIKLSPDLLRQTSEAYRRIRNTFKFLIGNLYDFEPARDGLAVGDLEEFDRWMLGQLGELTGRVRRAYENYEFHRIYHLVHTFCSVQISALYVDVVRDRLYCSAPADATRRAAQTVCHALLDTLTRLVAPVLVFTADEVWEFGRLGPEPSVHMADLPAPPGEWEDAALREKFERLLALRGEVAKALEEARRAKTIGGNLDAQVSIAAGTAEEAEFCTKNIALLRNLFIVSHVRVDAAPAAGLTGALWRIEVKAAAGRKCERCWMIGPQVASEGKHTGLCPRCAEVVGRIDPSS